MTNMKIPSRKDDIVLIINNKSAKFMNTYLASLSRFTIFINIPGKYLNMLLTLFISTLKDLLDC